MPERAVCLICARPIHRIESGFAHRGEWVHSEPLKDMKVSVAEHAAIMADPPRKNEHLHRMPVLHQPEHDSLLGTP
jgi:hypothetical protein